MSRARFRTAGGPWRVTFVGQSLNNEPDPPLNYPSRLMTGRGIPWGNLAINGWPWIYWILDEYQALVNAEANLADETILILQGGQDDLTGQTPVFEPAADGVTIYNRMVTLVTEANYDYTIATTIPPAPGYFSAGEELVRQDFNTVLLADGSNAFDYVVDLGTVSLQEDDTHPDEAGAQAMADDVAVALDAILA